MLELLVEGGHLAETVGLAVDADADALAIQVHDPRRRLGIDVGIVAVAQPGNDVNKLSYLGYLGIAVVTPPAASLWAAEERTRAGTAVDAS